MKACETESRKWSGIQLSIKATTMFLYIMFLLYSEQTMRDEEVRLQMLCLDCKYNSDIVPRLVNNTAEQHVAVNNL